jgi:CRP-like cAMP-binding protein
MSRALRLVTSMAIAQQPKLDIRLWMLFWELADRYGKVSVAGVRLELPLTHDLISHLVGAHRPSVSAALSRLEHAGYIRREGRQWLLLGAPPQIDEPAQLTDGIA